MNELHHRSTVQHAETSNQISVPQKRDKRSMLTGLRFPAASVEDLLFDGGALAWGALV